jgi:hypothetical protein
MHQEYLHFKFSFTIELVSKQDIEKQFWRFLVTRPNLEVRFKHPPNQQKICVGFLQEGTQVIGANGVGPARPSGMVVPMIFHEYIKQTTTSFQVPNSSPK